MEQTLLSLICSRSTAASCHRTGSSAQPNPLHPTPELTPVLPWSGPPPITPRFRLPLQSQVQQDLLALPPARGWCSPTHLCCPLNLPVIFNKWNQTSTLFKKTLRPRKPSKASVETISLSQATWAGVTSQAFSNVGNLRLARGRETRRRQPLSRGERESFTPLLHLCPRRKVGTAALSEAWWSSERMLRT